MKIKRNELITVIVMVAVCMLLFVALIWLNQRERSPVGEREPARDDKPVVEIRAVGQDGTEGIGQEQGSQGEADPLEELKGKRVQVNGVIRSSFGDADNNVVLYVEMSPSVMAKCVFPPESSDVIGEMDPGYEVTVVGTYVGKDRYLRLKECAFAGQGETGQ